MSREAASGITIAPASAGSGKTGRLTADVASEDAGTLLRQALEASRRAREACGAHDDRGSPVVTS